MPCEFDGKKYEKASAHQKEWGNKLISELNLNGNEKILDLGCGDGVLTQRLSELVPNGSVLGIDASKGMIDVAKEKKSDNLKFILMDIDNIKLDEKFDIIFSNTTLHWIKNHNNFWDNIEKLLNPNGKIRFNFASDGNCSYFFSIVKLAIGLDEFKTYFANFDWPWFMPTLKEYEDIIKDYSFSKIEIWEENADRYFPTKEALIGWIEQPSIVPFLKYLPNEKKESFKIFVIEKMLEKTLQKNGQYFETFRRINVMVEC